MFKKCPVDGPQQVQMNAVAPYDLMLASTKMCNVITVTSGFGLLSKCFSIIELSMNGEQDAPKKKKKR
jgi:hypothetical protein